MIYKFFDDFHKIKNKWRVTDVKKKKKRFSRKRIAAEIIQFISE